MTVIQHTIAKFEKASFAGSFLFKLYSALYATVLKKEIELAGINENDLVLNIGCGAMPFTAIYIAKHTGAKVIAIDKDFQVIEKAVENVENSGMKEKIIVSYADGKDIGNLNYTKVIAALQAWPKVEIFENLWKQSKLGTKLLFRQPRNFFRKYYGLVDEKKAEGFVRHNMVTFDKTLLFEKKQGV